MQKILIINDEPLVCDVVSDCLQDLPGTVVIRALRGKAGAQLLRQEHLALALIDCVVPEVSGPDLAALAAEANIPALLLAGDPALKEELLRIGFPCLPSLFMEVR